MKNRYGFISSKYRQPDEYRQIFNAWCAIYRINGEELHIQLVKRRPYLSHSECDMEILKQEPNCRISVYPGVIHTLKETMAVFERILPSICPAKDEDAGAA